MVLQFEHRPNNIPDNRTNHLSLPDIIAHRGIQPAAARNTGAKMRRAARQ